MMLSGFIPLQPLDAVNGSVWENDDPAWIPGLRF